MTNLYKFTCPACGAIRDTPTITTRPSLPPWHGSPSEPNLGADEHEYIHSTDACGCTFSSLEWILVMAGETTGNPGITFCPVEPRTKEEAP